MESGNRPGCRSRRCTTAIDKLKGPRPLDGFLGGTLQHFEKRTSAGHVALSACQSSELAKELIVGDEHRGAFTATMIEVLETVGDKADYRSVIAAVRSRLERTVERQRPCVYPVDAGGLGDGRFLDGTIEPAPASFLMTKSDSGWSVDAGAVHGLRAPADGEEFRFACLACPTGRRADKFVWSRSRPAGPTSSRSAGSLLTSPTAP